jgi:predicted dehydrogenase
MQAKTGMSRRDFILTTAFAGASAAIASRISLPFSVLGSNDRLRIGVIGVGGAGLRHLSELSAQNNVEIAALCDLSNHKMEKISAGLSQTSLRKPELFLDFRRILDRQDIDAVSIAVPRARRASMAIKACEAGKDVLIEGPCCAGLSEGRELEKVAKQTGQLVQQTSHTPIFSAPELLATLTTHGTNEIVHVSGSHHLEVDAEMLQRFRTHERTQPAIEQSLDVLDLARIVLGVRLPVKVSTAGFIANNLPNAASIRFAFPRDHGQTATIQLNSRISIRAEDAEPTASEPLRSINLTFMTGQMQFGVQSIHGRSTYQADTNSLLNFVSCVRERNSSSLQNPIQEARVSSALIKLAETSLILGRAFTFDPNRERAANDDEADALIQ